MKIYDFDKTIYNGDSSVDFWLFCLWNDLTLIRFLPIQVWGGIRYYLKMNSKESYKQSFFSFLNGIKNIDKIVNNFWSREFNRKIKTWYLDTNREGDVIISASPEFLLEPAISVLKCKALIASRVDKKTGRFISLNCYGSEKVTRFREDFGVNTKVIEAYSDSLSDLPILNLADMAYIVKKNKIITLVDYQSSKLKTLFLNTEFIRFLLIGCINAFLGVILSSLFLFLVGQTVVAFMLGFAVSLIPSYVLNTIFTFNSRAFNVGSFVKFCISYIPNFIIQLISIAVLDQTLKVPKVIIYVLSVSLSVPITFALLKMFAFNKVDS